MCRRGKERKIKERDRRVHKDRRGTDCVKKRKGREDKGKGQEGTQGQKRIGCCEEEEREGR